MDEEKRKHLLKTEGEMTEFLKRSLRFWLDHGISDKGGYFVCFDGNGQPMKEMEVMKPTDKMIVTQTRMIWGFSAMVRSGFADKFGFREECILAADQGVDFFLQHFLDKENLGFAWYTDEDGKVQDNGKLVYGQTFAMYALAEYTMATGNPIGLKYAEMAFDMIMRYAADTQRGGYYENMTEDWVPETEIDKGGDLKSLDIHMHMLEGLTSLYECSGKEIHRRRLEEVVNLILKYMVDYRFGCGCNQFTFDFIPKPARNIKRTWNYDRDPEHANQNPLDTTSYGHNIEMVWLLNRAYQILGEAPAKEFTRIITDYTITNGWDSVYGGIYRDGMHDGRVVVTDKEWWQNFESLTGFMDAYEVTGDERYLDKFLELWQFDYRYFYNQEVGESRQLLSADGTPIIADIGNQWKCIYHTDRAMLECIPRIRRILGETSWTQETV